MLLCAATVQAQLSLKIEADSIAIGKQKIAGSFVASIQNQGADTIKHLTWLFWTNAYQPQHTALSQELLEDQNLRLAFAKDADLGFYESLQIKNLESNQVFEIENTKQETQILSVEILPGQSISLVFSFMQKLPNAKYNGFGFTDQSLQLSNWLPQLAQQGTATTNSRNREAYFVPAKYKLHLFLEGDVSAANWVSNLNHEIIDGTNQVILSNEFPAYDMLFFANPDGDQKTYLETENTNIQLFYSPRYGSPNLTTKSSWERISSFWSKEFGTQLSGSYNFVFLDQKKGLQSAGKTLVLSNLLNIEDTEAEIVEELVKIFARENLHINPEAHPWLVAGMANYYKHLYFQRYYPDKKLFGPLANTAFAKFFDLDHYPVQYQNRVVFLYMARQGLDQPLNLSATQYTRANYEAVVKGKGALSFAYLRSYAGDKNYLRAMRRWQTMATENGAPEDLINHLGFYHNRDLSWFLGDYYTTNKKFDYALKRSENCTSIYTATLKNKGQVIAPISVTGYKNGKPVLTEWIDGFAGKKTVQIHFEDYTRLAIDADEAIAEYTQKNNDVRTTGLFRNVQPLKIQFYTSFENPKKTQIFWLPSLKFNAYDKVLLGAQFYNQGIFLKPWEYRIAPEFSTGTGQLTGSASLQYNYTPHKTPFHLISFGAYSRYYHYAPDLSYTRLSPSATFFFRKKYSRQQIINSLRLRGVSVNREVPLNPDPSFEIEGTPKYQVLDIRFLSERTNALRPTISTIDVQFSKYFSRASFDIKQRWQLSKNHLLTARVFAGTFFTYNEVQTPSYFQFGLSGTRDYMFDYNLIGRSDKTGIWSKQFFVTDGGFKSQTNQFFYNIQSASINIPAYKFVGVFADVAHVFGKNTSNVYWDYGVYLELIPDFIEFYFPIQSSFGSQITAPDYFSNVRFVLNIDLDAIVNRARRGFY